MREIPPRREIWIRRMDLTPKRNLVKSDRSWLIATDPTPKKLWVGDKVGKRATNHKGRVDLDLMCLPSWSWPQSSPTTTTTTTTTLTVLWPVSFAASKKGKPKIRLCFQSIIAFSLPHQDTRQRYILELFFPTSRTISWHIKTGFCSKTTAGFSASLPPYVTTAFGRPWPLDSTQKHTSFFITKASNVHFWWRVAFYAGKTLPGGFLSHPMCPSLEKTQSKVDFLGFSLFFFYRMRKNPLELSQNNAYVARLVFQNSFKQNTLGSYLRASDYNTYASLKWSSKNAFWNWLQKSQQTMFYYLLGGFENHWIGLQSKNACMYSWIPNYKLGFGFPARELCRLFLTYLPL